MLILKFPFFILLSVFIFTIPGLIIFKALKIKLQTWEGITLSTILGLVSYNLLAYFFHLINLPLLTLFFVLSINIYVFKNIFKSSKRKSWQQLVPRIGRKKIIIAAAIFLTGIIGQLSVISPSGRFDNKGNLIFYSAHGHDSSWHIALMDQIQKGFPLKNPDYSGEKLTNYHFLSDIAPADFNQFFRLSSLDLYFRYFPLLYSVLLGLSAYYLGRRISKSFWGGIWATIFTFFAGSFGYIVTWIKGKTIGGESIFWSSQVQSSSGNPPQIISNIIFLADLIFIYNYLTKPKKGYLPIIIILTGVLSVTKIYASIVILPALLIVSFFRLLKDKNVDLLLTSIIIAIFSLLLFLPNTSKSESFLIFQPWWFIRTLIVEPSRLNLLDWELKRQTYLAEGNFLRVLQIETYGLLIFIFGNIGMRFIGLYWFLNNWKKLFRDYFYQILIISCTISFVFPILFLQKGVAGNTIQTFQYLLLILGVLAGVSTYNILRKIHPKLIKESIVILIIILSVPTQISLLYEFYSKPPITKITKGELQALDFLKNKSPKDSIILTPPYDQYSKFKKEITPNIWAWYDTSYVSAFSKRTVYFADYEQMDIMGYKIKNKQETQKQIFSEKNPAKIKNLIRENNIDYIYFPKEIPPTIQLATLFKKVFENQEVEIWKTKI